MIDAQYRLLQTAEEVDEFISDAVLDGTVDWFDGERTMPADDFFDRLFKGSYLKDAEGRELDLDSLDNPAARRIMARARKLRKEREL